MLSRIAFIIKVLDHLYPNPPIPLNHYDNFSLLVSVVLSAQTTDGKVNDVTKNLFKLAPTPEKLSKLSVETIQDIIQSVGLSQSKARYLKGLSEAIVEKFQGEVPSTFEELESLPGVGRKTASVIMSQAFGEPALAVDTHVHRLSLRWGLTKEQRNANKVQEDLQCLFPKDRWNKTHLQMIYFGREYCTAKDHQPKDCPICSGLTKSEEPSLALITSSFTPKKKSKGIVFYGDREAELKASPYLASGTSVVSSPEPKLEAEIVDVPPPDADIKREARRSRRGGNAIIKDKEVSDRRAKGVQEAACPTHSGSKSRRNAVSAPVPESDHVQVSKRRRRGSAK